MHHVAFVAPHTHRLHHRGGDELLRQDVLALGEGMAILVAPGNVPIFFDHDGVNQVIGDLSGRGAVAT